MAYPESRKEYMARMATMPPEEAASIVDIATPGGENVTEESFMASAPDYAKDMSFIQQPKPEPSMLEQAGAWAGESALGKMGTAGWDKGTGMLKNWWGAAAKPTVVPHASKMLAGAPPGMMSQLGASAGAQAAPGVMGKLGAAASGAGSGMMAGLGALGPIGIGLGGLMLAKRFGLFNQGGAVGPLSPQYKERGGYQEDEMSHRSKNMRVPYPGFMDFSKLASRNVMTAPSWWEKAMGHAVIPVDYGMSKLKHALHNKDYGLSRNAMNYDDPMVLNPGEVHQSMVLGPLSDERWIKDGEEFEPSYRNQGGEATSKPQSTKIEKKETIEYKN